MIDRRGRIVASGLHLVPATTASPTPADLLLTALDERLASAEPRLGD